MVSVVIPNYNLGRYLGDAVDSVLAQTLTDRELIIVDDGSTDQDSLEKLKEIGSAHPGISIIRQENRGLSEARNAGVRQAHGKYIVCLDADDKLDPSYLAKTVPMLEQNEANGVAVVTTWLQEFGDREDVWKAHDYSLPELLISNSIHAGSLFTKAAWKEVGGYKAAMKGGYEDWEFWLSIMEKGHKWLTVPEPLFRYRIRGQSMLAGSRASHDQLYGRLYDLHEALFVRHSKELLLLCAQRLKELHGVIAAKNASLDDLYGQLAVLKPEVEELRTRVNTYNYYIDRLHLRGAINMAKKVNSLRRGRR